MEVKVELNQPGSWGETGREKAYQQNLKICPSWKHFAL
jgi:hypothetical protein